MQPIQVHRALAKQHWQYKGKPHLGEGDRETGASARTTAWTSNHSDREAWCELTAVPTVVGAGRRVQQQGRHGMGVLTGSCMKSTSIAATGRGISWPSHRGRRGGRRASGWSWSGLQVQVQTFKVQVRASSAPHISLAPHVTVRVVPLHDSWTVHIILTSSHNTYTEMHASIIACLLLYEGYVWVSLGNANLNLMQ